GRSNLHQEVGPPERRQREPGPSFGRSGSVGISAKTARGPDAIPPGRSRFSSRLDEVRRGRRQGAIRPTPPGSFGSAATNRLSQRCSEHERWQVLSIFGDRRSAALAKNDQTIRYGPSVGYYRPL